MTRNLREGPRVPPAQHREEITMSRLDAEDRDKLPPDAFAFPATRKEPLIDAQHVRSAIARFRRAG